MNDHEKYRETMRESAVELHEKGAFTDADLQRSLEMYAEPATRDDEDADCL